MKNNLSSPPPLFPDLYHPYRAEREAFGEHWCGPNNYPHMEAVKVAIYADSSDGQPVEVWCEAAPARFYQIKALAGFNSVGDPKAPWELRTGSGMAEIAADIADLVSNGMLDMHVTKPAKKRLGKK